MIKLFRTLDMMMSDISAAFERIFGRNFLPEEGEVDQDLDPDPRVQILDEAKQYVTKDRNATHGEPEDNFKNIASLWTPWLKMRFGFEEELTPFDVAEMMSLFKKARKVHNPAHRDNHADDIGYSTCSWRCVAKESDARPKGTSNV